VGKRSGAGLFLFSCKGAIVDHESTLSSYIIIMGQSTRVL